MCTSPSVAIKLGVRFSDGKNIIKLYRDSSKSLKDLYYIYGRDNVLLIPCGHCSECILKRRKEWAVRCACEAQSHPLNCFVTLTYDDEHLRALNRQDPMRFIKALRNSGFKVRYYGCGELGSKTFRPHYHIILFGYRPSDMKYLKTSISDEAIFTSDFLEKLWNKGHVAVQEFGPGVAGYVAGYTAKKLGDQDGFQFQSTKPGIGYEYLLKHKDIALRYGQLFDDFGHWKIASLPRYFKKMLEKNGFGFYLDLLKEEKQRSVSSDMYHQARLHGMTKIEDMVFYGEHFADKKLGKLERSFNG